MAISLRKWAEREEKRAWRKYAGAGEGTRGGHVVGHTKRGKPIYGEPRDATSAIPDNAEPVTADAIKNAIKEERENHWRLGLRRLDKPPEVGSELQPSHVFNRNVPTRKLLPGASALPVAKHGGDVDRQLATLRSQYGGSHLVLLGSEQSSEGADTGEVVMEHAKVLRVWRM